MSATVMNSPDTLRNRSSSRPSRTTVGSSRPNIPKQLLGNQQKQRADRAGHSQSDARRNMHGARAAIRLAGAEILPGHRGRRSHQSHRRPRNQREQLRVAHRVRRLRFGALRQRANESKQHHARDVHRDALDACRQPEAKQRADDRRSRAAAASTVRSARPAAASTAATAPTAETVMLAMAVPIAAPFVPKAGIGPAPLINTTFEHEIQRRSSRRRAAAACAHRRQRAVRRRA